MNWSMMVSMPAVCNTAHGNKLYLVDFFGQSVSQQVCLSISQSASQSISPLVSDSGSFFFYLSVKLLVTKWCSVNTVCVIFPFFFQLYYHAGSLLTYIGMKHDGQVNSKGLEVRGTLFPEFYLYFKITVLDSWKKSLSLISSSSFFALWSWLIKLLT